MSRKYVDELKSWLDGLNLEQYSDEYNNWCYGTEKQKHVVHLHPYNTHADVEINNRQIFNKFLKNYSVRAHEWNPDNWLVIDVTSREMMEVAKKAVSVSLEKRIE